MSNNTATAPATEKTLTFTLREMFTPTLDLFTRTRYQGNHRDFIVYFRREGDKVTVHKAWNRGPGGFTNRSKDTYSIRELQDSVRDDAAAFGAANRVEFVDDLPEGHSVAFAA